jgi:hypothetical protein
MDEGALSSIIFESLRKCIQLREKYTAMGLQRKKDNTRDYPDLSQIPTSTTPNSKIPTSTAAINVLNDSIFGLQ